MKHNTDNQELTLLISTVSVTNVVKSKRILLFEAHIIALNLIFSRVVGLTFNQKSNEENRSNNKDL